MIVDFHHVSLRHPISSEIFPCRFLNWSMEDGREHDSDGNVEIWFMTMPYVSMNNEGSQ